ncbi:PLP-dependent aminotransferase family protein [bacterium D16-51]|nr:PLP-dependent aminotransferase family protein [bacterium D16-59]RKI58917.1 PLP-dependent aminotransferase family protein [bacterium D16-51]
MLTYSFTDTGSDCLYIHLYKCLKNDILSGKLTAGTKLPSKRSFAKNLGISTITVENAYAQLQSEGYIYSLPKKGFYITEITAPSANTPAISPDNFCIATDKPPCQLDLVNNQTNPDNFPFSIWAKLIRETISEKSRELMISPPCGGIMELRHAICSHVKAFRNLDVSPEQVIIGAGTEYLYGLLIQLLGFNKIYAVENPGYQKLAKIYECHQVRYQAVPLDRHGIDISALEASHADIAHITPSHHYPTGIVTSISRRYELLAWAAREKGRYIIEDDYDSEFRLSGQPIPALQSIDQSEKVIYINTFTKSLSSTVRLSYMILPKHLLEEFYRRFHFYSCTVSNFEQYTLARFLSGGYFEKHINRMRTHYKNVRDAFLDALHKSPFSSHIKISGEDAGLHFLMDIDTQMTDAELLQAAAQHSIHLACLSQYYLEAAPEITEHTLVLNYSGLALEQISKAIGLLSQLF